jgi:hypothetical protein
MSKDVLKAMAGIEVTANPATVPSPTLALLNGLQVVDAGSVKMAIDDRSTVSWECTDDGFTQDALFQVGKVVKTNQQRVIGYILFPVALVEQSASEKKLLVANVPFIPVPQDKIPEAVLKEAVRKMKMPEWFANGTPPRKTPLAKKASDGDGWTV